MFVDLFLVGGFWRGFGGLDWRGLWSLSSFLVFRGRESPFEIIVWCGNAAGQWGGVKP
jgi:hypothetical protein